PVVLDQGLLIEHRHVLHLVAGKYHRGGRRFLSLLGEIEPQALGGGLGRLLLRARRGRRLRRGWRGRGRLRTRSGRWTHEEQTRDRCQGSGQGEESPSGTTVRSCSHPSMATLSADSTIVPLSRKCALPRQRWDFRRHGPHPRATRDQLTSGSIVLPCRDEWLH